MSLEKRENSTLVTEARLGNLDAAAVEVLRRLVDELGGRAELLYRKGEWRFWVHGAREEEAGSRTTEARTGEFAPGLDRAEALEDDDVVKLGRRTLGLTERS